MALIIHTNLTKEKVLIKLQKDLTIHIEPNNKGWSGGGMGGKSKTIYAYNVDESAENRPVSVPFNYGLTFGGGGDFVRPNRKHLNPMVKEFCGSLRNEQKNCRDEALTLLQTYKTAMICCYTGFGKTVTAINMACKIKLKTFITVPKTPLLGQWESEIKKFVPGASIAILTPTKIKELTRTQTTPDSQTTPDFCVVNACNIHKIPQNFLKTYGLVIVDEAHLQLTEGLSFNLLHLTPRYLLGITATPYREDGYNCLFNMFFGDKKVKYTLQRKHIVYAVKTGFRPSDKSENKIRNKVDWNAILDEQSKDESRNHLIINIVQKFKDRVFLILVKRVEQGQFLLNTLLSLGEKATSLLGKQQTYDKEARILIGTNSKIGTGFDHPRLDTLLVAADMVAYYIQFLGRVMRRKDVDPIIFDLVDSHPTLKKHFEKRSKIYGKHGGEILKYKLTNEE
ncbi:type III restriction enzyme, res subunit:DEAD/DEAH box helicase, N- terminal [Chloriridovirus anopheles1]|uniref:Type III restriction enzyme, res subunit:DEAD/DEAH box helicase, N-terminal n=1 Tax=Chloriridovirus anopheles1 TaxID=1465751 RepID=W8QE39_9VIRU|nr:type III restriction enzyme, res subunit:DEAD/DEAH box helicase, N- terminal [Anopheles minimus iridovirus]AHL67555.1 type III restriction enzyme, res subunit:DEAD/DEAH box helicase, N- terminal [Anopheles minimus iridovirus]